jgi:hypothetical protein
MQVRVYLTSKKMLMVLYWQCLLAFDFDIICNSKFRVWVVKIELSHKVTRVLLHDLILAFHRLLEDILNFIEWFTQVAAINKPAVKRSPVLHFVQLIEEHDLPLLKVVILLLIWSNSGRISEVRNPATSIKMLVFRSINFERLRRLTK